jgi:hypothetical protein
MRNVMLLATLTVLVASGGVAQTQEREIAQYSGNGHGATRPFTANCPCEIQWQATGSSFSAWLTSGDGKDLALIGNTMPAGNGTYYWPKSGTYFLKPAADSWSIRVIEIGH